MLCVEANITAFNHSYYVVFCSHQNSLEWFTQTLRGRKDRMGNVDRGSSGSSRVNCTQPEMLVICT